MVNCSSGFIKLSPSAMLVYFTLTNMLIYIDRGALSAVVTDLKSSSGLGLSSSEAGLLGSIFMLGYMVASPIFAHFAQFVHPTILMGIGLIVWTFATFLAGISRTYWLLLIGRSLTGIGEASFVALAPPYIIDLAPPNNKTMWLAIFYSALSVGNALGFVYGNIISNAFGGWYWPFLIESLLMIPFIILTFLLHKDPQFLVRKQGQNTSILKQDLDTQDTDSETTSFKDQIKQLLSNKIFVLLVIGYSSYAFTLGGLIFWGPDFLISEYDVSGTYSVVLLGGITLSSGIIGTFIGSTILERKMKQPIMQCNEGVLSKGNLERVRVYEANRILAIVTIIGSIGLIIGVLVNQYIPYLIGLAFAEFFILMGTGPIGISLMSCVSKELRGQANAVSVFILHLLGDFPSPYLIGVISDGVSMYAGMLVLVLWLTVACVFWTAAWIASKKSLDKFTDKEFVETK